MDNRGLKKNFDVLNKRYFDERVPNNTIVVFGKTVKNADGNYRFGEGKIVIADELKGHDNLVLVVLLHEMVHAKLGLNYEGGILTDDPHHGMIYQAELVRLFNAGAYDGLL